MSRHRHRWVKAIGAWECTDDHCRGLRTRAVVACRGEPFCGAGRCKDHLPRKRKRAKASERTKR